VVVVDHLDEWLDFRSLLDSLLAHSAGDFRWVAFNSGDEGVREWVRFCAGVHGLNYDDLLAGISASGDDSYSANFEELHGDE